MTRYELIVDINGYTGVSGLSTINIVYGGYAWAVGNTFSIGTTGAVGVVTGVTTPTGTGFRFEIISVDSSNGIIATNLVTGGSGYVAGSYFLVDGGVGSYGEILTVDGSGAVLTYNILTPGSGYVLNDIDIVYIQSSVTSADVIISGVGYTTGITYATSGVGFSLTVSGVTLNIIKNQYLDTYDDIGIALNYQISDINDISTSNTSYSKTINLPDTKLNRTTFEYIFGLNSYSTFDPTKKSRCWIVKDTSTQFTGYIQLTNIIYNRKTNKNEYQVTIYADNDTLWTNIGEKYLSDLNLNSYNHTYTNTNVINSWNNNYSSGYYYPLIDYVGNMDYNLVSGASSSLNIFNFKPAIYTKVILDQIFIEAGYTYTSDFLNSSLFKNLVIPLNNASLIPTLITPIISSASVLSSFKSNVDVNTNSRQPISSSSTATQEVAWNSFAANINIYNPNGYYNTTTHEYIHNNTDLFYENITINLDIVLNNGAYSTTTAPWTQAIDDVYIMIRRSYTSSGSLVPGWTDTPSLTQLITPDVNGTPINNGVFPAISINGTYNYSLRNAINDNVVSITATGSNFLITGVITSDNLITNPLRNGEAVRVYFYRGPYLRPVSGSPVYPTTKLTTTHYTSVSYNPNILVSGSYLTMNNIVPNNVKQRDFLSSIVKMFNLYIEPDKLKSNSFRIEPRDTYYSKYKVIKNWSKKLDVSQPIDSQIASNTQNRKNIFSYKADKDFYNTVYTNETSQIFGQYEWDINNDFISSEKKIEPIFSPTPLDQLLGSNNIYIPTIINNNASTSTSNGMNIRILYKNILSLPTSEHFYYNSTNYNFYPYAGPFDNPLNPNISLNYGQIATFYPNFNDTINNLFYGYWQDTMQELSDPTSRIVTAYFYLNSVDISQFYFSDLIFFTLDGQDGYYRVNKIIDYDPSSTNSTKVELLKTKYYSIN
jgi:hypothetical protein